MSLKPSEYASYRGVSKQAVSKAIKLGRITLLDDVSGKHGNQRTDTNSRAQEIKTDQAKGNPSATSRDK